MVTQNKVPGRVIRGRGAGNETGWTSSMSERLQGVRDLVGKHGWWLLDQYGVLHDGKRPYNGAVEAVKGLNESGESMVIISNSSRRASHAEARLDEMGFKREWFQGFVTSGEMAHNLVMNREFPVPEKASKVVHLTWSARGAAGVDFDALGLEPSQPEEADFVLAHGCEALDTGGGPVEMDLDSLSALALSPCAQRNLPMVVANPDMETVTGDGHKFPMPGGFPLCFSSFPSEFRSPVLGFLLSRGAC